MPSVAAPYDDGMASRTHVVIGSGPVGSALALLLAAEGEVVSVVTRSGGGPRHPRIDSVATDAADPAALAAVTARADVVYNCANPGAYTRWEKDWPPLAAAILHAAESAGAVLVTAGNLYGYGRVDRAMARDTPLRPSDHKGALRVRMWEEALAAHEAGRVRVAEARASDYIGPAVPPSHGLLPIYASATLADRPAWVFADPDVPHSWTAVDDVARTLAVLGEDERAWGKAWIVPTNPPRTTRETLAELSAAVGARPPRLRRIPRWALSAGGAVVPLLREVGGVLYQFDRPFVVDSAETTDVFGLAPTPWDEVVDATARAWRERVAER